MKDTNLHNDDEPEREGQWDLDAAEARRGVAKPRAVVSVAFARDDFDRVSECAEQQGKKTSEFIREAAMDKVVRSTVPMLTSSAVGPTMFSTRLSTATAVTTPERDRTTVG